MFYCYLIHLKNREIIQQSISTSENIVHIALTNMQN